MPALPHAPVTRPSGRRPAAAAVAVLTGAALALSPAASTAGPSPDPLRGAPAHRVVASGLDNPRQLTARPSGALVVAEAGHGSNDPATCGRSPQGPVCVGRSGRVTVLRDGRERRVMGGLLSGAGPDGSFATGSDGASKRVGGAYYSIVTYAPPDLVPAGLPGRQAGKLVSRLPGGDTRVVADVTGFEKRRDPDGEGVDSNPYSVLALGRQVLVADAAADAVLSVRGGKVRLWHLMEEYGPRTDAVPTVLAKDGRTRGVLVGELHSEQPGEAKVWLLGRRGEARRTWGGFTTVTGVARSHDGTLWVSELFGGPCTFAEIPSCFPGRVVRVDTDGSRTSYAVPFPAGVVASSTAARVVAFSTSPSTGFGGNPAWSGQVWRIGR